MGLDNVNSLEANKVELEFTIARDIFDAAVDRQFKKNMPKMNIPGFRKGKAPRAIVEKMYGKGVFYEDALNDIIPDAYEDVLKESGAEAVSRPEFDVTEIAEDGIHMKAVFFIKPDVTVGEYKGMSAERVVTTASDSDVDAELSRARDRNSRTIDINDRPAAMGDTVVIDYAGTVDGVAFEGGTAEKQSLKLGSHTFIDTFEDQIAGHSIGDEFDVNVTFPENYGKDELNGKAAVFHVVLHEIKFTELPELDDEFAKDVSDFDTLDEYKADIRSKLQQRYDSSADAAVEEQLIDSLCAVTEADIPAPMIDSEVETIIRDRDYSMRSNGLSLEMYLKYTNSTLDDMRAQVRPQAERQVKTRLALEKIAALESIAATDEDIAAEYEKMAKSYQMEIDKIKEAVPAENITGDIKLRKAVEALKAAAVITEKTAAEKEAEEAAVEAAKKAVEKEADKEIEADKGE